MLRSLFLIVIVSLAAVVVQVRAEVIDYNRDIRPLLSNRCFRCHGPDAETREGGLRLDRAEKASAELDSGDIAIVPGDVEESQLLARVRSDDEDLRMPPADIGPPLSEAQIALLEAWIKQGATFDQHWSLKTVERPPLETNPSVTAATSVDTFVDQQLGTRSLTANPRADRAALIRRVSLAITGVPPTPQDVERFTGNANPAAYEQLVERLLASPRYGERWARVWLDIARYADSAGYAQDPARTIWRYRDWVIDAYNVNKTFAEFTIEQIAGDQLPNPTNEQLLATAFHRNTMTNSEGGTDDEEFRSAAVVDRVNTTMEVWMGLTMACAQCHDHKYDDISQKEYFQVFAILNNTQDADRPDESPWLEELTDEERRRKAELRDVLAKLGKAEENAEKRKELKKQLDGIKGIRTPIMRELAGDKRRKTHVHVRGNFRVKDALVEPGVPAALHELDGGADRLALARWLVSENNPLTARVVVNRYWELLFGRGLVATSEDFGMQGELPTHPKLLDYLAAEFMRHDWDTKWLIKEIVTSDAYCRSTKLTPELAERDEANQWLARGPRFRLPAEMIRDQALAVSGLLSSKMLGPSVRPPRPNLGLRAAFGGSTDWETSTGEDRYRRGIYTSWRRTTPYPSMTTFDAPSREFCTVRRIRTNTPLQALVTLNDPVFVEASQALAKRLNTEAADWQSRADLAFMLVVSRKPSELESEKLRGLYDASHTGFADDLEAAQQMVGADHKVAAADAPSLAAWTVVCNVLLNLDETLAPR